jgi:hypothetical protein
MATNTNVHFSLKDAVRTVQHKGTPDGLYIEDVVSTFGTRSHAFIILFFCIPFLQPIPMMGLSTIFGGIMILLGIFYALGRRPWLPQKMLRKHLSSSFINSVCNFLTRLLTKTEKIIRPRFNFWLTWVPTKVLNGLLIAIFAFLLALPLPIPFSNTVPAIYLVICALGILEDDGFLVMLGYIYVAILVGLALFLIYTMGASGFYDWLRAKSEIL